MRLLVVFNLIIFLIFAEDSVAISRKMKRSSKRTDPCATGSAAIGTVCQGGTIYIGSLSPGSSSGSGTDLYVTTPGGCTDDTSLATGPRADGNSDYSSGDFNTTCAGGLDTVDKTWDEGMNADYDIPSLTNFPSGDGTDDKYGDENTDIISSILGQSSGGAHAAARFCKYMVFGGYSDWYLPSKQEIKLIYNARASLSGLDTSTWANYWTSTEGTSMGSALGISMNSGTIGTGDKGSSYKLRCVRRIK